MNRKKRLAVLIFLSVILVSARLALAGAGNMTVSTPSAPPRIDPAIQAAQAAAPDGQTRFIVYLAAQADLAPARALSGQAARGAWVYAALRQTAQTTQADLVTYLDKQRVGGHVRDYRSLWIVNAVVVTADAETVQALAAREDVARLALDRRLLRLEQPTQSRGQDAAAAPRLQVTEIPVTIVVTVIPITQTPTQETPKPTATPQPVFPDPPPGIEWNIARVRAPEVWEHLGIDGAGVVVANMDTGVLYDHPALVQQYRGTQPLGYDHNYNWFDATGMYPTAPADGHGHGTHTMGTMVGRAGEEYQIGVAPGAQWIAVKVLNDGGYGYDSDIHAGFQWLLAPTDLTGQNPDPRRAPQVVNNSWGNTEGANEEFRLDVQALLAAGIVPVFSAGNSGPGDGTLGAPGSYPEAWAVGATDDQDDIANFSSRGPSPLTTAIKPDLCAPGDGVRSSWKDGAYHYLSGTSMAAPHVTGLVALLLQANPLLTPSQLQAAILDHVVDLGEPGPDYAYGWGRIDAYETVLPLSAAGRVTGQVRETGGAPIPAASVDVQKPDGKVLSTVGDAQGVYTFTLPAGVYDMRAHLYGYLPVTATNVVVITDETTLQDFILPTAPRAQLSGRVTDVETGAPLRARVTVLDTPLAPVVADANGYYSLSVVQGTYTMQVFMRGYATVFRPITLSAAVREDFALTPLAPVLLVDDDGGADEAAVFTHTLQALGETFDVWDVAHHERVPTFTEVEPYAIVLWSTGIARRNLSPAAQTSLIAYLDAQGQLFLDNYTYDKVVPTLMEAYLHVIGIARRGDLVKQQVRGAAGNPVGAWLGPYPLTYPNAYDDMLVLTPDSPANIAFTTEDKGGDAPVGVTYLDRPGGYRTLYLGFPFGSLQGNDGVAVLNRVLKWFRSGNRFGTLTGQVTSAHTGAPVGNATLTATGPRDQQTVRSDAHGVYTLTLLANTYTLRVQRGGYFEQQLAPLTVTEALTTVRAVALQPQVTLTPMTLTAALTAGQRVTHTLSLSNAGSTLLAYRLNQTGVSYTSTLSVQGGPPPVPAEDIPEIIIPAGSLTPTVDGIFTATAWADAAWVEVTPLYDPQGMPQGKLYLKHAAGNLYLLADYYLESGDDVCLSHDVYFSLDGYNQSGHLYTLYCEELLSTRFSYPGRVAVGQSATPDNPVPHWILEYEIPFQGMGVGHGATLRLHTVFRGNHTEEAEWANVSFYEDYYYFTNWGRVWIEPTPTPWLALAPLSGKVAPGQAQPLTLTLDTALAQPGVHRAEFWLVGLNTSPAIAEPRLALTLSITPSATMLPLRGVVSDARTGTPLAATLALSGGTPINTDARTGEYVFWLEPGTWEVHVKAPGYLSATVPFAVGPESALLPYDVALTRAAPHLSLPAGLAATVLWGQTVTRDLVIGNLGPQPLAFQLYETAGGVFPQFAAAAPQADVRITTAWPSRRALNSRPARVPLSAAAPMSRPPLSPFLCDPEGDVAAADFVRGAAAVSQAGWDGESPELFLQLTFAAGTDPRMVVGYVHLDTDQTAATGYAPRALAGSVWQDIGYDYYLDLFSAPTVGDVDIWRYDGRYLGAVPGVYVGQSLEIVIPLALLGHDDGRMDVALALGTVGGVTEQVPAQGHGTLGLGLDWLSESPETGRLETAASTTLGVTFDAARLQPGVHTAYLAIASNDPTTPIAYLPLTLTVEPAATMGRLTGRVLNTFDDRGLRARVLAETGAFDVTAADGIYELWLPAGQWRVRAGAWPLSLSVSQTLSLHLTAGETRAQDFVLWVARLHLPVVMREK